MFTCFAYDTIPEAACASQRLHTISFGHAMCHLLFPLTRRVFSPCHIFCQSFATCVAIAFARNASFPFVATCVAKGFCSQPKFCHSICRLCFCPRHVFASVFCHRCCHYICPRRFFPSMLPCRLPPPLPLPLLLPSKLPSLLPSNLGA